uniref:TRAF1-6 MATH domain-containing protein n=1 Tax=Salvator merianae TaxID=96440 RepID=A0A8D0DRS2_SALMN
GPGWVRKLVTCTKGCPHCGWPILVQLWRLGMNGLSPYDDVLPWPFRHKVTFMLLDPTRQKSPLTETFLPDPYSVSFQQPQERLNVASGSPLFASHIEIPSYLKDDTLYLKVVVVDLAGMEI